MLSKTDLILSSEKIAAMICLGIHFTKNLYHIETSQFICIVNKLSSFYIFQAFTDKYFKTEYSYFIAMPFIYSFSKNWNVLYSFEIEVITSILQKIDHLGNWFCQVWTLFQQQNIWFEAHYCSRHVPEEIML